MPVRSLTDAERDRLTGFPREMAEEEVFSHFTLTGPDGALVPIRVAPEMRLGFALSLCAVRYLGFCPEDLTAAPKHVLWYVGQQVGAPPDAIARYGQREQTRSDHLKAIHDHLGYRRPTKADLETLSGWLAQRALEHEDQTLLVSLAAEWLKAKKLVRPALYRLERRASSAREEAAAATYRALSHELTAERTVQLDRLLLPVPGQGSPDGAVPKSVARRGLTPLAWLKDRATSNTPGAIKEQIAKLRYLRAIGADRLDVSSVNPNRLKLLAAVGRRYTNQALRRQSEERRHPVLAAALKEAHTEITDEVVDLFDQCLAEADRRSRAELAEFRKGAAKATDDKVRLFNAIARLLLDGGLSDADLRGRAFALAGSEGALREALADSERLLRPLDDNYYDFFAEKYTYVRQLAPAVLDALSFRSNKADDPLLKAVSLLGESNETQSRSVPNGAPLGFVPPRWEPYVLAGPGRIDRRFWEMCLLWQLRGALRSGDIWVEGARRYADPQSFLIPEEEWPSLRPEVRLLTGTPSDGERHLKECREEMEGAMRRLEIVVDRGGKVQAGKLVFSRDDRDEPPESAKALGREVSKRLPKVELTDLVVEVDSWTHFLSRLTHAGGSEPRTADLRRHLHAAILAQATNVGPVRMADLADLSYEKLAWAYTWYLREDTMKDAVAAVVDFHHGLPLSSAWGGGTLSSSDGQRFPVDVRAKNARALPRYFGYGKGVTLYSWTSDQFSQFGTKVIPATVRDATYVLDGILGNETDLPLFEHTVDTHGFTETVFALFACLGMRFSPRIKDVADQVLYGLAFGADGGTGDGAGTLDGGLARSLLSRRIDHGLILKHWDDIQRVVGSLKFGWVTASLFASRLEAKPRKSGLAKAIQEYGRLQKTLFLLRYAESEDLRRRVGRELNKGEDLHALGRLFFFAGDGKMRRRDPVEQGEQALCSNLLADAVVSWNTVYYRKALDQLVREGHTVRDEDIAHLWPTRHAHINPYGKYAIDVDGDPGEDAQAGGYGRRPLRPA